MVMEFMSGATVIGMKESGVHVSEMEMAQTSFPTMISTLGNIAMAIPTASVNINGLTVIHMLESFLTE